MPSGVYLRTEYHRQALRRGRTGCKHSDETKKKLSDAKKGSRNPSWKGGISPLRKRLYFSEEYKNWRKEVFERDNYLCVIGGKEHGDRIQADHIMPWSKYPELRFELSNGRTLCVECHRKTDTYGRGKKIKINFNGVPIENKNTNTNRIIE